MNAMSFTYVKSPTDTSHRVFLPILVPTDKYFGIDISELDAEDQGEFQVALEELIDEHKEKIEKLMEVYDIKHAYRHFFPGKMENVVFD